jgi:dephospho-CoA kinase
VVGIVGGLGSGKSTVARLLAERGARVVDADKIVHRVLELPRVKRALRSAFGDRTFDASGRVSRSRLADMVFGHPDEVAKLNNIVHPPVIEEIRAQVGKLRKEEGVPLIVLDAALLMETNLDAQLCQVLLFVDTPAPVRLQRTLTGRGISADQFSKREQAQLPVERKKERANYAVHNAGALQDLERQLEKLWPELCRGRPQD